MTDLDASASNSAGSAPATESEILGDPVPVLAPLAGDPGMLGLPIFIVGSVALGLVLAGHRASPSSIGTPTSEPYSVHEPS